MAAAAAKSSKVIALARQTFRAVKCHHCGAKMYPQALLQAHLTEHRRQQRWLNSEMRKLRDTFTRMRDFA